MYTIELFSLNFHLNHSVFIYNGQIILIVTDQRSTKQRRTVASSDEHEVLKIGESCNSLAQTSPAPATWDSAAIYLVGALARLPSSHQRQCKHIMSPWLVGPTWGQERKNDACLSCLRTNRQPLAGAPSGNPKSRRPYSRGGSCPVGSWTPILVQIREAVQFLFIQRGAAKFAEESQSPNW